MGNLNPILILLSWRVRRLNSDEIQKVLAAVASIEMKEFTLTDVIDLLPAKIRNDRRKRRSVGKLLQHLVKLGYLSKPSERKWSKNSPSLSHFLAQHLLDLSSLERSLPKPVHEEKIVSHREFLEKSGKPSSR